MSKVAWIIFAVVVVGVLGGLVAFSRANSPSIDVSSIDANAIQPASDANGNIADHVFGNADSKVILIEYGDFQCPSCGNAYPPVKLVTEEYKDRVAFVFRNFPLTTIHPNARVASATVEAAGLQGKYWEMYDLVFENQNAWSNVTDGNERTDLFVNLARQLDLDTDKFLADLSSSSVNQKISFDQAIGNELGVNSTPTFYLNGEKLEESTTSAIVQGDADVLRSLLDQSLGQQ